MSAAQSMVVAAAQFAAGSDVAKNVDLVEGAAAAAADGGAELVVLPEASMYSWDAPAGELSAAARTWAGYFTDGLVRVAARHRLTLVAGAFAAAGDDDDDPRPYNRLLVVDADGVRHQYDKVHLYDAFGYAESDRVRPGPTFADGAELATVTVGGFTAGLLNCYDLRFPEMARLLVDRGADLLTVSAAWVAGSRKEMHWELLLRARAVENTAYVVGACQPPPTSIGLSMVVDPTGVVMGTCATHDGLVVQRMEQSHLREVRDVLPALENRRYPPAVPASGG